MIEEIEIEGYRSVRSVRMRMKPVLVRLTREKGETRIVGQGLIDVEDEG